MKPQGKPIYHEGGIRVNNSYEAESLEQKIHKALRGNEPINDSVQIIYTNRKDGVQPGYKIRTDRFEVAIEASDRITQNKLAKREELHKTGEQNKISNESQGSDTPQSA